MGMEDGVAERRWEGRSGESGQQACGGRVVGRVAGRRAWRVAGKRARGEGGEGGRWGEGRGAE